MAAQISKPAEGEDVRVLWRKVAEIAGVVNALQNMTVLVEGKIRMTGKLNVSQGSSELKIVENTEVGSLGN